MTFLKNVVFLQSEARVESIPMTSISPNWKGLIFPRRECGIPTLGTQHSQRGIIHFTISASHNNRNGSSVTSMTIIP